MLFRSTIGSHASIWNYATRRQPTCPQKKLKGKRGRTYGADPDREDLARREAVRVALGRAVHAALARRAPALGFAVQEDPAARLRDGEEVHELDDAADDELDPELHGGHSI